MWIFSVNNLWHNIYLKLFLLSLFGKCIKLFPYIFLLNKYRLLELKPTNSIQWLQRHLFSLFSGYHTFSISDGLPLSNGRAARTQEKEIAENGWNIFLASSNFVGMSEYSSFIKEKFHFVKSPPRIRNKKKLFFKYWPTKIMVLSFILSMHKASLLFFSLVDFFFTLVHSLCCCLNIIWLIKKLMKFVCYRFSQRLFKKETARQSGRESKQTRLWNHLCGH